MQFESAQPQFLYRPFQFLDRQLTLPRIYGGKADESIWILPRNARHVIVANVRDAASRLGVNGEDDAKQIQRFVSLVHLLRRTRHIAGLEISGHVFFL